MKMNLSIQEYFLKIIAIMIVCLGLGSEIVKF